MTWIDKIVEWASWTKSQFPTVGDLPQPGLWRNDVPWYEDFLELRGEDPPPHAFHEAFLTLIHSHDGFAARFVGLDFYHQLAHQEAYPYSEDVLTDARAAARAGYKALVAAIAPADVSIEQSLLDWELRICSLLRMWDRADALFDRFGQSPPESNFNLSAARAQHLFMRRYLAIEIATNDLLGHGIWFGRPITETERMASTFVGDAALRVSELDRPPDAPSVETVYSEITGAEWPRVSWLKPLMLGRVEIDLELVREAIAHYESALEDKSYPAIFRDSTYETLSVLYDQVEDATAREAFLYRWSFDRPEDPRLLIKLATLAADSAQYDKAYQLLRKAVSLSPELERDLGARIGLAFGAIGTEVARASDVREMLARHPDIQRALEAGIALYWPAFRHLNQKERPAWATAVYTLQVLTAAQPTLAPVWNRQAATGFLAVVELQLRRRVFEPLAQMASDDPVISAAARRVPRDSREWILAQYLLKSGHLTLGQMLRILERCSTATASMGLDDVISKKLAGSPVLAQLDALRRLATPRNEAIHELGPMEAATTHADARSVIETLIAHSGRSAG